MFEDFVIQNNLPKYRTKQLEDAYYKQFISSWDEVTSLPKDVRERLKDTLEISLLKNIHESISDDHTAHKVLFELKDKNKIEAVMLSHEDGRRTICVSCQVGCPVGCEFCATGKLGFKRNLTAEEIVDQVLYFERVLKLNNEKVTNVVFMGMGEPMLTLPSVTESIKILTEKMELGSRKITVSTSGYIKLFEKFTDMNLKTRLAVSLHAPNQNLRAELMPVANSNPLDKLMEALDRYTQKTNKRISYEYVLIDGVNNTDENADELVELLKNRLAHVNLIPYNPIATAFTHKGKVFKRPSRNSIRRFADRLSKAGINTTVRFTMGDRIAGACGQLARKVN